MTTGFNHHRAGTTDAELLFLLAHQFGLDGAPRAALETTIGYVQAEAERLGIDMLIRFTAAFSDGETLYAVRYATDRFAPTLYSGPFGNGTDKDGFCLVSEPFEDFPWTWSEIPADSFVEITDDGLTVSPFCPRWSASADMPQAIAV